MGVCVDALMPQTSLRRVSAAQHASLALQEYLYALLLPDGDLMTLPGHETFSAAAEVSITAPWPPGPPQASQAYSFALFVRDAYGLVTGPFTSRTSVTVDAPACPPQCRRGRSVLEDVQCLACEQQISWTAVEQVPCAGRTGLRAVWQIKTAGRADAGVQFRCLCEQAVTPGATNGGLSHSM